MQPVEQIFPADPLELVPDLPRPDQRWTVARKATVIQAVRGGWVPIEEVCALYNISPDEFLAWERDVDRYGVPGLRSTRVQIYRTTVGRRRALLEAGRNHRLASNSGPSHRPRLDVDQ